MKRTVAVDHSIRWVIRHDTPELLLAESACTHPWSEEQVLCELRQRDRIGVVIESPEHDVVGYMIYQLCKSHFELLRFAVRYPYRRQGYGRRLIWRLIDKLSLQKRNRIVVHVDDSNLGLQLFLQQVGFRCVQVTGNEYRFVYRMRNEEQAE